MTPFPWTDLFIIAGLIVLNGVFAMSELAIVSAKTNALRAKRDEGSKAAATAIRLAAEPGKFLSTVQIGITLIAIITGAYSGASLEGPVGERLALLGVPADMAGEVAFVSVIAVTTYLSVVVGELVPKQLALRAADTDLAGDGPADVVPRQGQRRLWSGCSTSRLPGSFASSASAPRASNRSPRRSCR